MEFKRRHQKRHEKYVVVIKAHGVFMKGISIRGKANDAFNDGDDYCLKNIIYVILNVEVLTSETSPDNLMHNILTHIEHTESGYNINVFQDITEDFSEEGNEYVNQDVSDNLYDMLVTESPTQKEDFPLTILK
ncbi:unnamed protein product [Vicia faba]|uniref:Uncharacterized protein n=1 Tax=Vicia faba TaxID=3906 RepID=A0AAV1A1S5_VICFA|nr:unnamed protein product [Vicia faba]